MAESTSPKGSGDFAKKVQRRLSRGKEMVLQKLGKAAETKDDEFEHSLQQFNDQQSDGNRIYKDLRNYINAIRDMREASRRLSQSLFDAYECGWAGEEDVGSMVEGEDLLWNDYEVKMLDQAVRTMESYVSQFPDVREKIGKRGRKLVDYDSSRHHLEALQSAKKRDDIKIKKAEDEMNAAKTVYEGINNDLKDELPVLFDSRIGCYISVFTSVATLRETFYKEMSTINSDLQTALKELQAQHPDKVFAIRGLQRYGSLKRKTLMSPKAWKTSFSEFHKNYSPKPGQRFSFRSSDKSRHGTLTRESSSSFSVSSRSGTLERTTSGSRDLDTGSNQGDLNRSSAEEGAAAGLGEDTNQVEEEKGVKEEQSEPKPLAESADKGEGEKPPLSESSSELSVSGGSESLQLSAADIPLHIEESEDNPEGVKTSTPNGLENGEVSGLSEQSVPHKNDPTEKSPGTKNTTV